MAFAKDQDKQKLLILCRAGSEKSEHNIESRRYCLKVFD